MNGNRRVFVTGGAHGIGKAIVLQFIQQGDTVAFCDIDSRLGKTLENQSGAKYYHLDVCDVSALHSAIDDFIDMHSDIDIIINNVGVGCFKPLIDLSVDEFDRVMDTNLRPVFLTARKMAAHRTQNHNISYGRIINICSTRYLQSEPGSEAYAASKGAIYSLTHALAVSLSPLGITVNAIAPGWIHVREDEEIRPVDTQFHLSRRVGTPDDVARLCLYLAEEENNFINGQTITVDGGATVRMIYPE